MDASPNCAICNAPPFPECSCESDRLQLAVKQAEKRAMEARLVEIRSWVITHAREHILQGFKHLTSSRKAAHATYLSSLPYYSIYMQYSGHPPLHPAALAQLQAQISEAHAELKRGIDADWRSSVLRYPEVLDYFYGLVEVRLPHERSPSVVEPTFLAASFADSKALESPKEIKKKYRSGRATVSPERRPMSRMKRPEEHSFLVTGRRMSKGFNAPPAPTPPLAGGGYPFR